MTRWIAAILARHRTGSQSGRGTGSAGRGVVEVTIIPGGWTFFTEGRTATDRASATTTWARRITFNVNRFVGIEGEVSGALGITQDLQFGGLSSDIKVAASAELQRQHRRVGAQRQLRACPMSPVALAD